MPKNTRQQLWQTVFVAAGALAVLIGGADIATRVSYAAFGDNAAQVALGPAVSALDTSVIASAPSIVPARLVIPTIGVDAAVERVGKKADGSMGTPKDFNNAGWYQDGSKPGEPGNAVLDGHVNNALTKAGVFEHLVELKPGDTISVLDASGAALVYRVSMVASYPTDKAPLAEIFKTTGSSQLVLITCTGDWIQSARSFNERLVVYASLVQS